MIIPIGNTGNLRRIPYITIFLILTNIIFFAITSPKISKDTEKIYSSYENFFNEVMDYYIFEEKKSYLEVLQNPSLINDQLDSLTIPEESEYYTKITELRNAYNNAITNHVLNKMGVSNNNKSLLTFLTSMFTHADIFHLIGNLWFLLLLGANVEDVYGRLYFLIFYILSGIVSSLIFLMSEPTLSLVGASGAIAGVMGAFLVRHFKTKIQFFYFFLPIRPFYGTFKILAGFVLPLWFLQQVYQANSGGSQIAFMAHIGGFLFGVIIAYLLSVFMIEEKYISPKIEESTNLLGITKNEESGLEDFYNKKYSHAINKLEKPFLEKIKDATFIPLFTAFIEEKRFDKAAFIAQHYFTECINNKIPIYNSYIEMNDNNLTQYLNPQTKYHIMKYFYMTNKFEECRVLAKNIIENNKYKIIGAKTLLFVLKNSIDFENIEYIMNDYIENNNDDIKLIIDEIQGVKNDE